MIAANFAREECTCKSRRLALRFSWATGSGSIFICGECSGELTPKRQRTRLDRCPIEVRADLMNAVDSLRLASIVDPADTGQYPELPAALQALGALADKLVSKFNEAVERADLAQRQR